MFGNYFLFWAHGERTRNWVNWEGNAMMPLGKAEDRDGIEDRSILGFL